MRTAIDLQRMDRSTEQKSEVGKIVLRGFIIPAMSLAGIAATLFILAGRAAWIAAWVLVAAYYVAVIFDLPVLWKFNSEVIHLSLQGRGRACTWDRVLAAIISIFWLRGAVVTGPLESTDVVAPLYGLDLK